MSFSPCVEFSVFEVDHLGTMGEEKAQEQYDSQMELCTFGQLSFDVLLSQDLMGFGFLTIIRFFRDFVIIFFLCKLIFFCTRLVTRLDTKGRGSMITGMALVSWMTPRYEFNQAITFSLFSIVLCSLSSCIIFADRHTIWRRVGRQSTRFGAVQYWTSLHAGWWEG